MLYSCSRCGKIHKYGECTAKKTQYKYEESKYRNTNDWHKKAEEIKKRSHYLCSVCKDRGIYTYNSLEVHHIIKLRDNPKLLLDNNNLICLCTECHKKADRGEIGIDYLYKLVKEREEK